MRRTPSVEASRSSAGGISLPERSGARRFPTTKPRWRWTAPAWCLLLAALAGSVRAETGARYLIICADSFVDAVQPLARWKTQKGMLARVVPMSQVGATPSQIQTYIRNAWNNWPLKPEYVLLVGSPELIPSYSNVDDCYYGNMTGNYVMEIAVGRLPAHDLQECATVVAKCLAYERPPPGTDTLWYVKGTTVVGEVSPPDQYHQADCRHARALWIQAGYVLAESLWHLGGHTIQDVTRAINDGRGIVGYRGDGTVEWGYFRGLEPDEWTNRSMMPVTVAGTCMTVTLAPGESMYGDRFVLAGTPEGLGGAVAYFGTTRTGSSMHRSAGFLGTMDALYLEGEYRLGKAAVRGRWRIDSLYHSSTRYTEWNLLGDPELNVWTGRPRHLDVTYPHTFPMAQQAFPVTVTAQGAPVARANVCVWMDSVVYAWGSTDSQGYLELPIYPTHLGNISLTVTGRNLFPFEDTVRVVPLNTPYLVLTAARLEDFAGNRDSLLNPGESVRVHVTMTNVGPLPARDAEVRLDIHDSLVTITDSTGRFGTVEPGDTVTAEPVQLYIAPGCPDAHRIYADMVASDSAGNSWLYRLTFTVHAGLLRIAEMVLADSPPAGNGNGRLGPSEAGRLRIAVTNCGSGALLLARGRLAPLDSCVVLSDSTAWYGALAPGDTAAGVLDYYSLSAGPLLPQNRPVPFRFRLAADGGSYPYLDSVDFTLAFDPPGANQPTGPDDYGYWLYEDTDTATGRAPRYDWYELAPPGPGTVIPEISDSDTGSVTLRLPFPLRFYGAKYDSITVTADGLLIPGSASFHSGQNRALPDVNLRLPLIAPFWDDLNSDERMNGYGAAYQHYDSARNRWIVEYRDFAHFGLPSIRERFQVQLFDPRCRVADGQDAEIRIHYQQVWMGSSCTVGIQDATGTCGIEYVCDNLRPPSANQLRSGRAVRIVTERPFNENQPWLVLVGLSVSDSLGGNGNGRAEPGETLELVTTVVNSGTRPASAVQALLAGRDPDGQVLDSTATLGPIPIRGRRSNSGEPFRLVVAQAPVDSTLDLRLSLSGQNYVTALDFTVPLFVALPAGMLGAQAGPVTRLGSVCPNPASRATTIAWSLAEPSRVELVLYDAGGRRVRAIASGRQEPGMHTARLNVDDLSQGVYFCRLAASGPSGTARFARKLLVTH